MKNVFKLFGLIAIVAVIGLSMVACDEDTDIAVQSISIRGDASIKSHTPKSYQVDFTPGNATNQTYTWEVVSGTATITQNGELTATAVGSVTIKATASGKTAEKTISVTSITVHIDGTYELRATQTTGIIGDDPYPVLYKPGDPYKEIVISVGNISIISYTSKGGTETKRSVYTFSQDIPDGSTSYIYLDHVSGDNILFRPDAAAWILRNLTSSPLWPEYTVGANELSFGIIEDHPKIVYYHFSKKT